MLNEQKIRKDFEILNQPINGKPLVYLDSTATSLKPAAVLAKLNDYYTKYTANIFRGIYKISEEATAEYENSRKKVAAFIGCTNPEEIVFTRNASESLNLIAYSWGLSALSAGDHVVVSIMEHHSNFVPWQQLGKDRGWVMDIWRTNAEGELDLANLDKLITRKTKLLTITAVSNVLGTINPIEKIVQKVKSLNSHCIVVVDAAQAVPHMSVDVSQWGADFVVFSSHKMLGPTGTGVLWGRYDLLDQMRPYNYGGEMIAEVYEDRTVFKAPPHKFEAGTPHIAGVIGLGAAVDYLSGLGMDAVRAHEKDIVEYTLEKLHEINGITVYGPKNTDNKGGVVAFTLRYAHAHDVAQILDEDNVCIRSGNHCAMPLHVYMGVAATARASFYVYTSKADIDLFIQGLHKVQSVFT